jgi:hypothetical protein
MTIMFGVRYEDDREEEWEEEVDLEKIVSIRAYASDLCLEKGGVEWWYVER